MANPAAAAAYAELPFAATLDYEQVSLSPTSAVHAMLKRQATLAGKQLLERVFVSNLNAVLRVVLANLAVDIIQVIIDPRIRV